MSTTAKRSTDYWSTSREPWPSLLFILPFLVVYEIGAFSQSHVPSTRNGADLWIRHFGMESGMALEWVFPLLAPILLLGWQLIGRRPWGWSRETYSGMLAESLLFAMLLVVIGQVTAFAFPVMSVPPQLLTGDASRAVSFLGAGIYEEMLFRLTLLPAVFVALKLIFVPTRPALAGSVIVSSWLFATAHYLQTSSLFSPEQLLNATETVLANPDLWFSFTFRFLAGVLFACLFWIRGFGIAVGCHILYDLFVGIVLAHVT